MLHDEYLKNNEDNHKLTIQNEQLLEKLQDTIFSSYVSDCQNGRLFGGFSWHGGSWEMWKYECALCVWILTLRDPNTLFGGRVTWIVSWWRLCNF